MSASVIHMTLLFPSLSFQVKGMCVAQGHTVSSVAQWGFELWFPESQFNTSTTIPFTLAISSISLYKGQDGAMTELQAEL